MLDGYSRQHAGPSPVRPVCEPPGASWHASVAYCLVRAEFDQQWEWRRSRDRGVAEANGATIGAPRQCVRSNIRHMKPLGTSNI